VLISRGFWGVHAGSGRAGWPGGWCLQSRWFPIPREAYDVTIYAFLGGFKIVVIVFDVVSYVALSIIG